MTSANAPTPLTRRQLRDQQTPPRRSRVPAGLYSDSSKRQPLKSTLTKNLLSVGALLFVGALVIGTSVPASAFVVNAGGSQDAGSVAEVDAQSVVASGELSKNDAARAKYSITTQIATAASSPGARGGVFTPTTGAVRWPFPYSTAITDGFGYRKSPCAGCSTFHKGTDFVPGAGAPTYSIADGIVESSVVSNSGLGNEVIINHEINGKKIQSLYGHLQMNSSPLRAGDHVKAGDLVGKVGATGTTTGANMHLEVHVSGIAVNAFVWLKKNATDEE